MKYIVFSDIHGNIMALDGMFVQTRGMDIAGYIFCGDIFGYFTHPREVIRRLGKIRNLYAVKGNHDIDYLRTLNDMVKRSGFAEKYGMSYLLDLSADETEFLYSLPDILDFWLDGLRVAIIHGNMTDHLNGRIYPDTDINDSILYTRYDIVILGHTHYQMIGEIGGTIVLNPGSLGQPRDHKGFSFCILDTETVSCSFHTVEMDIEALFADLMGKEKNWKILSYIWRKLEGDVWNSDI